MSVMSLFIVVAYKTTSSGLLFLCHINQRVNIYTLTLSFERELSTYFNELLIGLELPTTSFNFRPSRQSLDFLSQKSKVNCLHHLVDWKGTDALARPPHI